MTHGDRGIVRRFRLARVLPRLAFVLSLLAVLPASAQDAPTQTQCSNNWYDSSAAMTCRSGLSIGVSNNKCRIQVKCPNAYYTSLRPNDNLVANDITVSLADTDDLSNCNGALTVGSC